MSTPTTPMMKRTAVKKRDSASTDSPLSAPTQHNGARNCDEEQHAGQLEREQVILEQRVGDYANRVQLLQLLLVEIPRHNELLWQLGAQNDQDLTEEPEADCAGGQFPPGATHVGDLRRMPEVEEHHNEQKHDHDGAGVDEDLHHADELRIQHHVNRR